MKSFLYSTWGSNLERLAQGSRLMTFLILLVTMPILSMAEPNKHRDGECGHESYSDNYYVLSWDKGSDSFPNEGSNNLLTQNQTQNGVVATLWVVMLKHT